MKLQIVLPLVTLFLSMTACGSKSQSGDSSSNPVTTSDPSSTTSSGTAGASSGGSSIPSGGSAANSGGSSGTSSGTSGSTNNGSTSGSSSAGNSGSTTSGGSTGGTSGGSTGVPTTNVHDLYSNGVVNGQTYFIRNAGSKLCVDLENGVTSDGAIIQSYDCEAGNPNQLWMAQINSDGSLTFVSTQSSECLDLAAQNIPQEDNGYQTWTCSGAPNQSFSFSNSTRGGYQIANMGSLFQCVTDGGQDGEQVTANTCSGQVTQSYDLIPGTEADPTNAVRVAVSSSSSSTCATASGPNMTSSVDPSQINNYLLGHPILVQTNAQCDAYCGAYSAVTCVMTPDSASGRFLCSPLSSSGLTSSSAAGYAVACTSN